MRAIVLSLLCPVLLGLPGCGAEPFKPHHYGQMDCSTQRDRWAMECQEYYKKKADAEIRQEVAELLKSYRLCLQKYEDNPTKAKANCSVYNQALHEIDIKYREMK